MTKPVFCLMGPTAAGKTALAIELFKCFSFEIISVDSALIYREMNIGTAKPSPEQLQQVPHHLINIINPPESYSVGQFCEDTVKHIEAIYQRGKFPLLVGGTMMYFNGLQQGLALLPQADETLRNQLLAQAETKGWSFMYEQLKQVDIRVASRIHPHDTQRIQRALEVYFLTGKPLSSYWSEQKEKSPYKFVNLILFPKERAWLHEQIALRFESMLKAGLIKEVRDLIEKWNINTSYPSMRSVGYRQVLEYIQEKNKDEQILYQRGVAATRQLAKRQLTWLRHWEEGHFFTQEEPDALVKMIAIIREILDNLNV